MMRMTTAPKKPNKKKEEKEQQFPTSLSFPSTQDYYSVKLGQLKLIPGKLYQTNYYSWNSTANNICIYKTSSKDNPDWKVPAGSLMLKEVFMVIELEDRETSFPSVGSITYSNNSLGGENDEQLKLVPAAKSKITWVKIMTSSTIGWVSTEILGQVWAPDGISFIPITQEVIPEDELYFKKH
jgi:hypothetical protein